MSGLSSFLRQHILVRLSNPLPIESTGDMLSAHVTPNERELL